MNIFLEELYKTADEIISQNLTKDMTEQQIIKSIYEDDIFVFTMTKGCPTSFLTCC